MQRIELCKNKYVFIIMQNISILQEYRRLMCAPADADYHTQYRFYHLQNRVTFSS